MLNITIYLDFINSFLRKVPFLGQYAIQLTVFHLSAMSPWAPLGCDNFLRVCLLCALVFTDSFYGVLFVPSGSDSLIL